MSRSTVFTALATFATFAFATLAATAQAQTYPARAVRFVTPYGQGGNADTLPGYQASIWTGMLAPDATPRPVSTRLNAEVVKALRVPEVVTKLTSMGVDNETSTLEEFGAFINAEIAKWTKVIRDGNIKVEMER